MGFNSAFKELKKLSENRLYLKLELNFEFLHLALMKFVVTYYTIFIIVFQSLSCVQELRIHYGN
jgi:hypothetical protein